MADLLAKIAAPFTLVNSNVDTEILNIPIPGDLLAAGEMVRVDLLLRWINNTGVGQTFTITVSYGATVMWKDTSASVTFGVNEHTIPIILYLFQQGANQQVMHGIVGLSGVNATVGSGDLADITTALTWAIRGTAALDTSKAGQSLTVKFQHSATDPNLSVRREFAVAQIY